MLVPYGSSRQNPWSGITDLETGRVVANEGISSTCCKWKHDKCDDCKCSWGKLKFMCSLGCGKECCNWNCDVVTGLFCGCSQGGVARSCDHSSGNLLESRNHTMRGTHQMIV